MRLINLWNWSFSNNRQNNQKADTKIGLAGQGGGIRTGKSKDNLKDTGEDTLLEFGLIEEEKQFYSITKEKD